MVDARNQTEPASKSGQRIRFKEEFDDQEIWWHSGLLHFHWHEDKAVVVLTDRYGELEADKNSQAGRSFLAEAPTQIGSP